MPITSVDKIPTDPATRKPMDLKNPSNWMSEEAARATGMTYGFVLSPNDPYAVIDLDKCLVDGKWTPEATEIFTVFKQRGAAAEISTSGAGLHLMFRMDAAVAATLRNKIDGWKEFYQNWRFLQFGPTGWEGDPDVDCTDLVQRFFPPRDTNQTSPPAALSDWTDPEWAGPADDDELIKRMLASKGSVKAQFGEKATFDDLWHARDLGRFYPDPDAKREYDFSSADLALASKLAFWCGKNTARIERLMRLSALKRDKWVKHPTLLRITIGKAVSGCQSVYNQDYQSTAEDIAISALVAHNTHENYLAAFELKFEGKLLYNSSKKTWLRWNDIKWQSETNGYVHDLVRHLAVIHRPSYAQLHESGQELNRQSIETRSSKCGMQKGYGQ